MEFNLRQDIHASRFIFDCGVPLIHVPCYGVASYLITSVPELEYYQNGKNPLGDYLVDIVRNYTDDLFAWSKVIWDSSTIAWLVNPEWVPGI
ncbi:MAG: nucleoside hydrolase, partial [Halanaerobiaceae bacterium]|nr:nucleoside hydrolase [Halanaerobiaceae bacterium]